MKKEVFILTIINCSADCIYQKDRKCNFENITIQKVTPNSDCAYFVKK